MKFKVADLRYKEGNEKHFGWLEEELSKSAGRANLKTTGYLKPFFRLYESLRDRGMVNPLVCYGKNRRNPIVLIGNQRLCCARALGWEEIEVVFAERRDHANRHAIRYRQIGYDPAVDSWEMVP